MKTFTVELTETEMRKITRLVQAEGEAEILSKLVKAQVVLNLATLRKVVEAANVASYTDKPLTELAQLEEAITKAGFTIAEVIKRGNNQFHISIHQVKDVCVQFVMFPPEESGRKGYEICCYVL